jgi:hypothetical protein
MSFGARHQRRSAGPASQCCFVERFARPTPACLNPSFDGLGIQLGPVRGADATAGRRLPCRRVTPPGGALTMVLGRGAGEASPHAQNRHRATHHEHEGILGDGLPPGQECGCGHRRDGRGDQRCSAVVSALHEGSFRCADRCGRFSNSAAGTSRSGCGDPAKRAAVQINAKNTSIRGLTPCSPKVSRSQQAADRHIAAPSACRR